MKHAGWWIALLPAFAASCAANEANTASGIAASDVPDGLEAAEPAGLDEATRQALADALDDERRSQAFYAAVLERFGERRPYSHIVHAEGRHAAHLLALFEKHALPVPDDRWADATFDVPATFAAACAESAKAERENVALYDRLLEQVTDPEVRSVMEMLRNASASRHLPAFERCAGMR